MAITNQDGLIAALATSQAINWQKSGARTMFTSAWMSLFDISGGQGAGVLAGTDTAAGVVPTDATPGCPLINNFAGANVGYLGSVQYGSTVACRLRACDMLFKAGAYNALASVTLASQPSYAARIPGGDYKGTELWIETVTAFAGGNLAITVTYTNQDGTAGKSTGSIALGTAPTLGRMIQLPLAAGDSGIQKIESVTLTGSTSGSLNLLVLRPLWHGRVGGGNLGGIDGPDQTDLPILFDSSALIVQMNSDGTTNGVSEIRFNVLNG
jgi:hypothetical protein